MGTSSIHYHQGGINESQQSMFYSIIRIQRTNGPVNVHLISGPTISTKTSFAKFDVVLKWVMLNSGSSFIKHIPALGYIMSYAKFHDHRTFSSV